MNLRWSRREAPARHGMDILSCLPLSRGWSPVPVWWMLWKETAWSHCAKPHVSKPGLNCNFNLPRNVTSDHWSALYNLEMCPVLVREYAGQTSLFPLGEWLCLKVHSLLISFSHFFSAFKIFPFLRLFGAPFSLFDGILSNHKSLKKPIRSSDLLIWILYFKVVSYAFNSPFS